jgi:hypothetical protein
MASEKDLHRALESAIDRYVAGQNKAVREFVHARYEAELYKNPSEAQKARVAAKEDWSRQEAKLKFDLDKALKLYLDESKKR